MYKVIHMYIYVYLNTKSTKKIRIVFKTLHKDVDFLFFARWLPSWN